MQAVLLLNQSFEPLRVISWQKAVTMFFLGKVEVVEEYDHNIRSVSLVVKAPAVVRLLRYARVGMRKPPLSRTNVLARDNFSCQYCGDDVTSREATLDHVIPRSQGGTTSWENIVCCCKSCNRQKGGQTPKQSGMPLKGIPRQPEWLPVLRFKLHGNIPNSWQDFLGYNDARGFTKNRRQSRSFA